VASSQERPLAKNRGGPAAPFPASSLASGGDPRGNVRGVQGLPLEGLGVHVGGLRRPRRERRRPATVVFWWRKEGAYGAWSFTRGRVRLWWGSNGQWDGAAAAPW
jgi:hypothetical protein